MLLIFGLCLALRLEAPVLAASPPSSGDWIVADTTIVENQTIELNGNLSVVAGGSLTLQTVTLDMNCTFNGEFGIEVAPGGALYVYDSQIKAGSSGFRYRFAANGSSFELKRSTVSGCGWGEESEDLGGTDKVLSGDRGPVVRSDNAVIDDVTFSNNHVGVILTGSGILLKNSTIQDNTVHGIYLSEAESCTVSNNSIHHGSVSSPFRIVESKQNFVLNNTIVCNIHRGGIELMWSHQNTFQGNTISGLGVAIALMFVSNDNTISENILATDETGIMLWGWNNRVEANTVDNSSVGTGTGIYLMYAYNSQVIGNSFFNIGWHGIWLRHSSNSFISDNLVSAQSGADLLSSCGLLLMSFCRKNVIHGNQIMGFPRGMGLFYSSEANTVCGNEFDSNKLEAAVLDDANGNTIYGNNFSFLAKPPFDSGSNNWSSLGQGNYWADYTGSDDNGDGIGDTPYAIGPEGTDSYPYTAPLDLATIPAPTVEIASLPVPGPLYDLSVDDERIIENQTLCLANVSVNEGGRLTLRNANLITGGSNHCSNLSVDSGGTLIIEGCTISHMDYGYGFQIVPVDGSVLLIKDTNLTVCGHEWPYGGIQIHNADVTIENSILSDTIISFFGSNTGTISGSTISRSLWAINLENASNIHIENNTVRGSIDGSVRCTGSNITVRGNEITGTWGEGLSVWSGTGSIVEENTVIDSNQNITGISLDETGAVIRNNRISNAATGIRAQNQGQTVEQNEIIGCITGIESGQDNTTVRNNTISACHTGIRLSGSGHTVTENTLTNCAVGVDAMGTGFRFYRNNFIDNVVQAANLGPNDWDNGPVIGGNHWSNHDCIGNPSNGNTPYVIEGLEDTYPFHYSYGWELGDINDNGVVDLFDAMIAVRAVAGYLDSGMIRSDYAGSHADVNGDNAVGLSEVLYIFRSIIGLH